MPPKQSFYFRHQPSMTGRYALLTEYYNSLNQETGLSRGEFVFTAVEAYWKAWAMEWKGKPEPLVRKAALNSIYRLELHIQYLREYFGLKQEESKDHSCLVAKSSLNQEKYLRKWEEAELDLNDQIDLTVGDQLIDSVF